MPSLAPLMPPPAPYLAPIDDASRREFMAILTAAGLLAGCSSDDSPTGVTPTTRRVTDRLGRVVVIPMEPSRLVVLDPARATVDAAALGVVPIGATTAASNPGGGFAPVLDPVAKGITSVGEIGEADLEKIAALGPDLILFATAYQETLSVDTLAEIAPVIAYERPQFGMVEPLRFFGEVLNKQAEAAQLESEYTTMVARRRNELGLEGRSVAVLNIPSTISENAEVLGPNAGFNPVLAALGAAHAPGRYAKEPFTQISSELLVTELADADLVVGLTWSDSREFTTSRVWQSVPAVGAGDVVYLTGQDAFGNYGLSGVKAALDDLAGQLA